MLASVVVIGGVVCFSAVQVASDSVFGVAADAAAAAAADAVVEGKTPKTALLAGPSSTWPSSFLPCPGAAAVLDDMFGNSVRSPSKSKGGLWVLRVRGYKQVMLL